MKLTDLFEIVAESVRRVEMTIEELYHAMTIAAQKINPDPISQRPSTIAAHQNPKNVGIIESILRGYGIDTIYLRDITVYPPDHRVRKQYPNDGALAVDGGHRLRAVRRFIEGKFWIMIDGKKVRFSDLQSATSENNPELVGVYERFMNTKVAIKYIVCTSAQAHAWFLMINKMTKTNEIESIMSDDESLVTEFIRRFTWPVAEYKNTAEIHPIFVVKPSDTSDHTTEFWNKANEGGSFYYHAFITLAKAIGKGNVSAGETAWKNIIEDNYRGIDNLNKETIEIWNRFFDDLLKYQKIAGSKKGLDDDSFGFFSAFWFHLLNKYGKKGFKLDMSGTLAWQIKKAQTLLTSKNGSRDNNKYDDKFIRDADGNLTELKPMTRKYIKAFSDGNKQEFVGELILREIEDEAEGKDTGIIIMDTKRSLSLKDKEALFAAQMGKCWLDYNGHPCKSSDKKLTIDDCVLAHDKPYAYGGKASDGVIMCNPCHSKQGMFTLNEYVTHLNSENA